MSTLHFLYIFSFLSNCVFIFPIVLSQLRSWVSRARNRLRTKKISWTSASSAQLLKFVLIQGIFHIWRNFKDWRENVEESKERIRIEIFPECEKFWNSLSIDYYFRFICSRFPFPWQTVLDNEKKIGKIILILLYLCTYLLQV